MSYHFPPLLLEEAKLEKMQTKITATFMVRGTKKDIERVKAHIAVLSICEEVKSLHIKEKEV